MLAKPNSKVLMALAALEDDHNFKSVLEWLEGSLSELDALNRSTKDETLTRWNQGASQVLSGFIGTTRSARAAISRSK